MLKANEAREMVERVIENEIAKLKENAEQFCEELSKEIEAHANQKHCNVIVELPHSVKRAYVVEILKANGYSFEIRSDGKLNVMWY